MENVSFFFFLPMIYMVWEIDRFGGAGPSGEINRWKTGRSGLAETVVQHPSPAGQALADVSLPAAAIGLSHHLLLRAHVRRDFGLQGL